MTLNTVPFLDEFTSEVNARYEKIGEWGFDASGKAISLVDPATGVDSVGGYFLIYDTGQTDIHVQAAMNNAAISNAYCEAIIKFVDADNYISAEGQSGGL
ncbi:MAG: hypothetical protein V7733_16375, partial [Paraglaciecola polaris]|uniref:hypothetical protein n=1 Tax=Paraglaciecola polaris TaxID=222814 RepID=UPI0030018372